MTPSRPALDRRTSDSKPAAPATSAMRNDSMVFSGARCGDPRCPSRMGTLRIILEQHMLETLRKAMWPALLAVFLFAPSLGSGFVYDDEPLLVENTRITI